MSVVINTNVDSIRVQNHLTNSTNKLAESMQRMSGGSKINSAKDDAAGCVISARMVVQLDGNKICQNNIQNANSLLSTTEGNIDVILDNVTRIRDLTLQAKNGTYSDDEISAMQAEVKERLAEVDRVNASAKFSDLNLFTGTLATNGATFQVGQNADGAGEKNNVIEVSNSVFDNVTLSALTGSAGAANPGAFNLSDIKAGTCTAYTDFNDALTKLDGAIDALTERKSLIGSAQNRLESALDTLTTQYTNLSSANSIIADADIASEASKFTQNQILQQVSTSLLAQANQAPGIALSLI